MCEPSTMHVAERAWVRRLCRGRKESHRGQMNDERAVPRQGVRFALEQGKRPLEPHEERCAGGHRGHPSQCAFGQNRTNDARSDVFNVA